MAQQCRQSNSTTFRVRDFDVNLNLNLNLSWNIAGLAGHRLKVVAVVFSFEDAYDSYRL